MYQYVSVNTTITGNYTVYRTHSSVPVCAVLGYPPRTSEGLMIVSRERISRTLPSLQLLHNSLVHYYPYT